MSDIPCRLPSDPDIAGPGVRSAVYFTGIFCFVVPAWSLWDGVVTSAELQAVKADASANLILAMTVLLSAFIQGARRQLSNYHAAIILNLGLMGSTNGNIFVVVNSARYKKWALNPTRQKAPPEVTAKESKSLVHLRDGNNSLDEAPSVASVRESCQQRREAINTILVGFLISVHGALVSSLGIWLWSNPQAFGIPDAANCAFENARLSILGIRVRFDSSLLRKLSLLYHSANLAIGSFGLIFVALTRLRNPSLPGGSKQLKSSSSAGDVPRNRARVLAATFLLCFYFALNLVHIVNTELTLQLNKHIQDSGESEWGFGQSLAVLSTVIPTLWNLWEVKLSRQEEAEVALDLEQRRLVQEQGEGGRGDGKGGKWGEGGEQEGAEIEQEESGGSQKLAGEGRGSERGEQAVMDMGWCDCGVEAGREDAGRTQQDALGSQERRAKEGELVTSPRSVLAV